MLYPYTKSHKNRTPKSGSKLNWKESLWLSLKASVATLMDTKCYLTSLQFSLCFAIVLIEPWSLNESLHFKSRKISFCVVYLWFVVFALCTVDVVAVWMGQSIMQLERGQRPPRGRMRGGGGRVWYKAVWWHGNCIKACASLYHIRWIIMYDCKRLDYEAQRPRMIHHSRLLKNNGGCFSVRASGFEFQDLF